MADLQELVESIIEMDPNDQGRSNWRQADLRPEQRTGHLVIIDDKHPVELNG